ncbi:phage shock protein E [Parabacteroides sp. PF5-5]|uniref:rhodanese-like domain-containing protein n=1 Tax=unclassified Parabacteroides TaxID=2649774 RepID=UPI0024745633|nr:MULTISPECIES: rhodanese-like domain-containing protein [unclassified Parabacteroides]MDH6303701.1 phage shock protein E [Parabacteroides sp. PH5-39]MDH6314318.1 phage shock protein E [Parabacteroides sp. PF5-13]MDH6318618.1 phage shock protein E [Parabacteroides sp. PH5-13]MDH6322090.1 phage shock protein E [Parabacteroides sp. PH5-8]MDH6325831.1 phage shock protein E [Parabacteroides sp. PH5-41]
MAGFFSKMFGLEEKADFKALLESGATLLDVRTKEEYKQGAVGNSINIPLDSLSNNLSKLKKDKPIIAVCASGMRSRSAVALLKSKGFPEVYNGGSWLNF